MFSKRMGKKSVLPFQFLMLTPPMKLLAVMLSLFAPAV